MISSRCGPSARSMSPTASQPCRASPVIRSATTSAPPSSPAASAMDMLPAAINRLIALGCLAGIAAYFTWLVMGKNRRELGQNGWKVVLPSARLTLLQILIGVVDLGFCACAMYLLMPMQPDIDFISLAVVFILATLLGFASHAPGSLGVFDAAMLVALPEFGKEQLLATDR